MLTQEFVKFELDIPKERQDLIAIAEFILKELKNLKRLDDASATNGSDNGDIESNERLKEFKRLFSGFVVKEIPKKEDLDYIRIKRYVK